MAAMLAPVSLETVRARKLDRRTEADDLRMELHARSVEASALCDSLDPLVRRLAFFASEHGPAAQTTVNELAYRIARFRRQWTDPEGSAA